MFWKCFQSNRSHWVRMYDQVSLFFGDNQDWVDENLQKCMLLHAQFLIVTVFKSCCESSTPQTWSNMSIGVLACYTSTSLQSGLHRRSTINLSSIRLCVREVDILEFERVSKSRFLYFLSLKMGRKHDLGHFQYVDRHQYFSITPGCAEK